MVSKGKQTNLSALVNNLWAELLFTPGQEPYFPPDIRPLSSWSWLCPEDAVGRSDRSSVQSAPI